MAEDNGAAQKVQILLQHVSKALNKADAGVAGEVEQLKAMARNPNSSEELYKVLANSDGGDLRRIRANVPNDMEFNKIVAPYEHRADFRGMISEEPSLLKAMGIAGGLATAVIPAYQVAKLTGADKLLSDQQSVEGDTNPTTPASLSQLVQGYVGVGEGIAERVKQIFK